MPQLNAASDFVRVPPDSSGKYTGFLLATVSGGQLYIPASVLVDSGGNTYDARDTSDRAARLLGHVTVDTAPTTAVTGTFWQATQPVSAAALPLPTGAAADATLTGGTQKSIPRGAAKGTTVAGDVTSSPVDANTQALHVVQAAAGPTQPVSGTVTANAGTGPFPVSDNAGSLTVDAVDTALGATVTPKAAAVWDTSDRAARLLGVISTGANTIGAVNQGATAAAVANAWPIKATDGTNVSAVKAASTAAVAVDPALVVAVSPNNTVPVSIATNTPDVTDRAARLLGVLSAGTNRIGSVRPVDSADADLTTVKGTQTARFLGVQPAKDSGRVNIMWTAEFSPAAVAEAMLTLTESRDGAAVSTASSKLVTNAKRLRITSVSMSVENSLGTSLQRAYLRLKFNTAGAVTTASPLQGTWAAVAAGTVKSIDKIDQTFPDGIEYLGDGTKQIGFSLQAPDWVTAAATLLVKVTVFAFEF